ncbi:MAG: hypothetical protein LBJ96_04870 [Holosporaceae bacterium]|nr:hypothetical protein [Holosporaceae bacterium]
MIFIEFVFAIPILVAILYYLHDIPKAKRMYAKMDFCAHCAVNIMQNHGKKITRTDLAYMLCASALTIWPGNTMYSGALGYRPLCYLYYVVGTAHNKCSVKWGWDSGLPGSRPGGNRGQIIVGSNGHSSVRFETNAEKVYPSLKIEKGEVKVILDICCHLQTPYLLRKYFGFYVISVPTRSYSCFHAVVIFTPKPGLFDETAPL